MTSSATRPLRPAPAITDERHRRRAILWLASGTFAIGAGEFAAMGLLPFFSKTLSLTEDAAGHAISAYALGVVFGAPLVAVFAARLRRKLVLLALMGLFLIGNVLSALATSLPTLEAARFIAGLPHGAYFGIGMLFAASLGDAAERASAVSQVMLGLAIANVVGVPVITAIGQFIGWRWGFALVAALALLTFVMLWVSAPDPPGDHTAHPASELKAVTNPRVLITLAAGAIGFGGMFAVYSYFSAAFLDTQAGPRWAVSAILMVYGVGVTLGNYLAGRFSGGRLLKAAVVLQATLGIAAAGYALSVGHALATALAMFVVGLGGGLVVPLQTRLMEVAGRAQTLAAALNHVAFNVANALGPWFAGMALASGLGWAATGWVGVALAAAGLVVLGLVKVVDARTAKRPAQA